MTSDNDIPINGKSWTEKMSYASGSLGIGGSGTVKQMVRTHTPIRIEYVGMDYESAKGYCDDNPSTQTYTAPVEGPPYVPGYLTITNVSWDQDGGGGYYKVTIETEVITDWVTV